MTANPLANKHITLAVTGGIAAYKSCELVRLLVKAGASVQVVMSEAAARFVGPLTFETLSGRPVAIDQFSGTMPHLTLTRENTDLLLVAPATANILAKAANGIADDLASTLIAGRKCPLAVAPAMNDMMWTNAPNQRNIALLKQDGVHVFGPACGELACGVSGSGRMLEPEQIVACVRKVLTPQVLAGKKVLVTAGPTYEPIDPVRGITNLSSGKQGYAVAQAAFEAGAEVLLISGPTGIKAPYGVKLIKTDTALNMKAAVDEAASTADIFISVAAVADWHVLAPSTQKIKKSSYGEAQPMIMLEENPDILAETARCNPHLYCVGFAAETQNIESYAREKLERKGVSLVVGNNAGLALGADLNSVVFVSKSAAIAFEGISKLEVAQRLMNAIACNLGLCKGEIS